MASRERLARPWISARSSSPRRPAPLCLGHRGGRDNQRGNDVTRSASFTPMSRAQQSASIPAAWVATTSRSPDRAASRRTPASSTSRAAADRSRRITRSPCPAAGLRPAMAPTQSTSIPARSLTSTATQCRPGAAGSFRALTPATFTVTTLTDTGAGSLRDAITQANSRASIRRCDRLSGGAHWHD